MSDPWARLRSERARQYEQPADMTPRPASASRTEITTVMQIQHANNDGNVHGGSIMRVVDEAAGIAAMRHARRRAVTAAMDDMSFLAPVYIGDLVTVRATVNDAHRTSMEVGARVDAENIATGEWRHVASAHLVFRGSRCRRAAHRCSAGDRRDRRGEAAPGAGARSPRAAPGAQAGPSRRRGLGPERGTPMMLAMCPRTPAQRPRDG